MARKKILVVDDSALMRKKIVAILESGTAHDIRTARDGQDALDQANNWQPDAITLDINMPVMDGLTCLSLLMELAPCPVVMVSSLTEKSALATFEAMELGAVDYVAKPGGTVSLNVTDIADELVAKVEASLQAKIRGKIKRSRSINPPFGQAVQQTQPAAKVDSALAGIVLIGVSTGGPATVEDVLTRLPMDFPLPIVVCQHMPQRFTKAFSERLNRMCQIQVKHLDKPSQLIPGTALIARGNADATIVSRCGKRMAISVPEGNHLWHPSVARLVSSAREHFPSQQIIAVMLTGMGDDGAREMAAIKAKGGRTIAESEDSAVVYGMPRELVESGGASKVLPCYDIAKQLVSWVR